VCPGMAFFQTCRVRVDRGEPFRVGTLLGAFAWFRPAGKHVRRSLFLCGSRFLGLLLVCLGLSEERGHLSGNRLESLLPSAAAFPLPSHFCSVPPAGAVWSVERIRASRGTNFLGIVRVVECPGYSLPPLCVVLIECPCAWVRGLSFSLGWRPRGRNLDAGALTILGFAGFSPPSGLSRAFAGGLQVLPALLARGGALLADADLAGSSPCVGGDKRRSPLGAVLPFVIPGRGMRAPFCLASFAVAFSLGGDPVGWEASLLE
jgi:hypothetical protein